MPLSTSNSDFQRRSEERMHHTVNDRLPIGPWRRVWIVVVLLTLVFLAAWESVWRSRGFKPELTDDADLWAWTRQRATQNGTKAIVFIGSSRGQLDLNLQTVEQETGIVPVQLAINGASPWPVLEDLAADPQFRGTVICDVEERHLFPQAPDHEDDAVLTPRYYVRHFHGQNVFNCFEFGLKKTIEQSAVFRVPHLTPLSFMQKLARKQRPRPFYLEMNADRSRPADYRIVDIESHRKFRILRMQTLFKKDAPPTVAKLRQGIGQMRPWIEALQRRGGEVLFVRFPMSGQYREVQEIQYPKRRYWDVFAREIGAPAIYFSDVPVLKAFDCPDGSHLDKRDTARFTKALLSTLRPLARSTMLNSGILEPKEKNYD